MLNLPLAEDNKILVNVVVTLKALTIMYDFSRMVSHTATIYDLTDYKGLQSGHLDSIYIDGSILFILPPLFSMILLLISYPVKDTETL